MELRLSNNNFSSAYTTLILSCLLESSCINTIELLFLFESCNLDLDETCTLVASYIDKAQKLREFKTKFSKGKRKVKVEFEVAKEGVTGRIKFIDITDWHNKQLFLQIDTNRNTNVKI